MPFASQLDSRIQIVTPENIAFEYRLAGPFRRLPAYLIDIGIRLLTMIALSIVLGLTLGFAGAGAFALGLLAIAWFVVSWFYGGLFETFWNGQTPGKRIMRLRVLTADGQPITATQAVLRNILRFVDAMPVIPIPGMEMLVPILPVPVLGLAAMMMNDRFQRLGDLASGTIVVVEDRQRIHGLMALGDPAVLALAAALPPSFVAARSLAQALSVYVSRRGYFAPIRRAEIAHTLAEPLRDRFNLPPETQSDQLLCALYYRTFIGRVTPADVEETATFVEVDPVDELLAGRAVGAGRTS